MNHKIIELEKIIAFQSDEIDGLKEMVDEQQKIIEKLEKKFNIMLESISGERTVRPIEDEEPPPHY